MAKKETAEQKLLKMIEVANASKGLPPPPSKTSQKTSRKISVLTILKACNILLIAGVIGTVLFLINEIYAGALRIEKGFDITSESRGSKQALSTDNFLPVVQRLSFYLASAKNRNIFQPYEPPKTDAGVVQTQKIEEAIKKLRLVGVSWLETVDSASIMIEDTEKQITYFLKTGEKLGDIVIKTIYADSALLGYENEEIMLKYDKSQM